MKFVECVEFVEKRLLLLNLLSRVVKFVLKNAHEIVEKTFSLLFDNPFRRYEGIVKFNNNRVKKYSTQF